MKLYKAMLISAMAIFTGISLYGQAKEVSVVLDKENRHAIMIPIEQSETDSREALKLRLERSGLKAKMKNGVTVYKGAIFSEISPDKVDIYTKVESGPNNSSLVYMAVSMGYNNFTNSRDDSTITANVKVFLQSFIADASNHTADMDITNQLNDIGKEEKAYEQLLDEQSRLQKQRSAIDSKLLEVLNDLTIKKETMEKKRLTLLQAKSKRITKNEQ